MKAEEFNESEDFNTSVGLAELLSEEEEDFSPRPTSIRTGVGGNRAVPKTQQPAANPNAPRFLFNPFWIIDLRNEGVGCGFPYLENVIFNQVKSLDVQAAKTNAYDLPGVGHNPENYDTQRRTALMIASELTSKHGDKGVIDIAPLLGESEENAGDMNVLLFGDEVRCIEDPNNDDRPCPVLPTLLEQLDANMRRVRASDMAEGDKEAVRKTGTLVRQAIVLGMRTAVAHIDNAQKRLLDEKSPNRYLSHAEQRCYLALGREIPNTMPFMTQTDARNINRGGGEIDFEAIGRGVAAGMAQAAVVGGAPPPAPVFEPLPNVPDLETISSENFERDTSFEVDETDIEEAESAIAAEVDPNIPTVGVKTGKAKKDK